MTDRDEPTRDLPLPEGVLEELAAAFSGEPEERRSYDFDDPSIDRLLGIDPTEIEDPTADVTLADDATLADDETLADDA
ncbi:MAG: hypothetical protein RLZ04_1672, partial [Actinomycetota bacterium]